MNFRLSPINLLSFSCTGIHKPIVCISGGPKDGRLADASSGLVLTLSATHEFPRYARTFFGLQRRAASHTACPPLIVVTGRRKPRSPPGDPFRGAFVPQMSEKRGKTAPENSSGGPGIALDMVLRGVVLSDNNNYRKSKNPPFRVDICVQKRLFPLEIPRRRLYPVIEEALERSEALGRPQGVETAAGLDRHVGLSATKRTPRAKPEPGRNDPGSLPCSSGCELRPSIRGFAATQGEGRRVSGERGGEVALRPVRPSLDRKTTPPCPPLSGGYKKAIPAVKDLTHPMKEQEINSPLEGRPFPSGRPTTRQGRSPQASWWGELFLWHVPPPHRPSHKPLGLCDSPSRGELILFCGG